LKLVPLRWSRHSAPKTIARRVKRQAMLAGVDWRAEARDLRGEGGDDPIGVMKG
jgi:hypothetical protein